MCPHCGAVDSLMGVGPGVERVAEEVRVLMPEARIEIFSSDTAQGGEATRGIVERMEQGEIDVLIGTQIVAKGHNFPNLTLVGVVDADSGMKGGDLRAGERTYQLLSQVAGRAGRAERPGRALVQTYAPDNPAMLALADGDRDGFLQIERDVRAELDGSRQSFCRRRRRRWLTRPRGTLRLLRRTGRELSCSDRPRRRLRYCADATAGDSW